MESVIGNLALQPLSGKAAPPSKEAVAQAGREFEALFIAQMLEHMFKDVKFGEEAGEESNSQEVYRSMMVEQYGKIMAQAGGIGVADFVTREMLSAQEVA